MSIDYLRAVFASDFEPYDRLVMLALADRADDAGACYPSIQDICDRTGMGERGVQNVVKRLVASGHLVVTWGGGRHQRNTYQITINPAPDAGKDAKPRTEYTAPDAGYVSENPAPHYKNPAPGSVNPAPDAGEPLRTVKEPSEVIKARAALCEVVSEEMADAFIAHRKAKRSKLTPHAATLIAAKLRGLSQAEAAECIENSIANGWTGVFPKPAAKLQSTTARGTRHDKNRAFGAAIHQLASGLSAGTVHLETASRNPWAQ